MIAVIALLGFKNVTLTSFIVPLIILAIPIMDTLFAIIRRLLKGEPPFKGDKLHLDHQLLNRNFSIRQTVFIIYVIDALLAFASILYILKITLISYILYGIIVCIMLFIVLKTNIVFDRELMKKKFKK